MLPIEESTLLDLSELVNVIHGAEDDLSLWKEFKDLLLQLGLVVDSWLEALEFSGIHRLNSVEPLHDTNDLKARDVDTLGNRVERIENVVLVRHDRKLPVIKQGNELEGDDLEGSLGVGEVTGVLIELAAGVGQSERVGVGCINKTQLAVDHHDLKDLVIEDVLIHVVRELFGKFQERVMQVVFECSEACQHCTVVD
jgi:hypothetical protein